MQVFLLATVMAALSGQPVQSEWVKLDPLFEGIENGCKANEAFKGFQASLAVKDPESERWRLGKPLLPLALEHAFGPPSIAENAAEAVPFVKITVPVRGVFKRFRVSDFEYARGIGNGITIYWIRIAAPIEIVRAALGEGVTRGNERLKLERATEAVNELVPSGEETLILCDLSS